MDGQQLPVARGLLHVEPGRSAGRTNLVPTLHTQRFLDVYMQDDSSVDYVDLVYRLCNCPQPTPTPR